MEMSLVNLSRTSGNFLANSTVRSTQELLDTPIVTGIVEGDRTRRVATPSITSRSTRSPEVGYHLQLFVGPSGEVIQVFSLRLAWVDVAVAADGCAPCVLVGVAERTTQTCKPGSVRYELESRRLANSHIFSLT